MEALFSQSSCSMMKKDCSRRSLCRTWLVCRKTVPGSKDREVIQSCCNSVPVYLSQCIHQFFKQALHTLLEACADVSHTLDKAHLSVEARPWRLNICMYTPVLYHRANSLWLYLAPVCLIGKLKSSSLPYNYIALVWAVRWAPVWIAVWRSHWCGRVLWQKRCGKPLH